MQIININFRFKEVFGQHKDLPKTLNRVGIKIFKSTKMTHSLELEKFGVSSLNEKEMEEIVGGFNLLKALKILAAAVTLVIAILS